jgi:hypothetical protein
MRKRNIVALVGAAVSAAPLVASAVTVTYQFDLADLKVAPTVSGAPGTFVTASSLGYLSGTAANPTLTLPQGEYFQVAVDVKVTGVTADATDGGAALGVTQFQTGLTNSNGTVSQILPLNATNGTAITTTAVNADFTANKAKGVADGAGGVLTAQGISGAFNPTGSYVSNDSYGGGAFAEIFNGLRGHTQTSSGTSVYRLTNIGSAFQYAVETTAPAGSSPAQYGAQTFGGTDVLSALPTLTVVIASSATSAAPNVTGSNKIIALAPSVLTGTAPNGYGTVAQGTLTSVNGGQSNTVHPANNVSGYVNLVGAQGGYVLLALALNGTALPASSTAVAAIIADINGSNQVGATALTGPLAQYASQGFDVAVPATSASTFAYDFSNVQSDFTDTDTALGAVTVTGIAAVPEPATAAGVILGAAGLLLGRRKAKIA